MAKIDKISDELLAAYLEGNTNRKETELVLQALEKDASLTDVLSVALKVDDSNFLNRNDILPMMQMAAESRNNICGIICEAYILQRRDISFEEKDLFSIAQQNHWLKPEGTPLHLIGKLLVHFGLMVTHQYDASFDDIKKALLLDNDVIVVVDSDKLFPEREDIEDAPNHAIVVTGINEKSVEFFDSHDNLKHNVHCPIFLNAWKESNNYMIRVLQSVEDYEPHPINLDKIELKDELLELQEAIAENAHDVWAAARIREGWKYGTERDDANKLHPDLVPYSALQDSEKEYDRLMALDTIKLVKKLGFEIIKK